MTQPTEPAAVTLTLSRRDAVELLYVLELSDDCCRAIAPNTCETCAMALRVKPGLRAVLASVPHTCRLDFSAFRGSDALGGVTCRCGASWRVTYELEKGALR